MRDQLHALLRQYFGFDSFRTFQLEAIEAILNKQDILTILPTGGGKSLCYQLPSLLHKERLTIVISPLIALINDQVTSLNALGINASKITSELNIEEYQQVYNNIKQGNVSLLYVSPERAVMSSFKEILRHFRVDFIVIDEAHCLSEWGHEFRPTYRKLDYIRKEFEHIPIAAFTATATSKVAEDIKTTLGLYKPLELKGSFFRKNLILNVKHRLKNGRTQLLEFIQNYKKESGIIYTFTQKETEALANFLRQKGIDALAYHAGMPNDLRKRNQELFIQDEVKVMVATIAFGMGIDKSNIRFVVHMDLPKSMESYYQEIGRAGRDGLMSECLLLFSYSDLLRKSDFMSQIEDETYRKSAKEKIEQLYQYASAQECRHEMVVAYFEEEMHACDTLCDNCQNTKKENITIDVQKTLSTVLKAKQLFGKTHIIDILTGSKNKKILDNNHQNLSVYAIGEERSKAYWSEIIDKLIAREYLMRGRFDTLKITPKSLKVLKGEDTILSTMTLHEKKSSLREAQEHSDIFEKLTALRTQIAKRLSLPADAIFSDNTLKALEYKQPLTKRSMLNVSGVTERKFAQYGEEFLALFKTLYLSDTLKATLELAKAEYSIAKIATKRNLAKSTIAKHIVDLHARERLSDARLKRLLDEELEDISPEVLQWYEKGKELLGDTQTLRETFYLLNHFDAHLD